MTDVFTNRELAIGVLILIVIIYAISVKSVRKLIPGLLKTMFNIKLVAWYISMIAYFVGVLFLLKYIGFWETRMLKDSIVWFFVVGVISTFRVTEKAKDFNYFFTLIKDNLKIIVLIEFISNIFSFSFFIEILLVFIATFISMLIAVLDHSPEFKNKNGNSLKKFFNSILFLIGILIIYHSIKLIIQDFEELKMLDILKDITLPFLLSSLFLFYMYLFAVVTSYEVLFIRLKFVKSIDENLRSRLKWRVLLFCNLNIERIVHFIQFSKVMQSCIKNEDDINKLFYKYRSFKNRKHTQEGSNFS